MAQSKSDKPGPGPDPWISELAAAGIEPGEDVTQIDGLVGDSPRAQHVRLYTNPDLSECLDIPKDAIRLQRPLDESRSRFGGVTLWVNNNARLVRTVVDSVEAESAYLEGDLSDDLLPRLQSQASLGVQGFLSTPICSIIASLATVTLAICTRHKTCPKTCRNCPFTLQRTCLRC